MTHKPTDESPRAVCAREYEAAGSGASGLPVRAEMDPPSQDPAGADILRRHLLLVLDELLAGGGTRAPRRGDPSLRVCERPSASDARTNSRTGVKFRVRFTVQQNYHFGASLQ